MSERESERDKAFQLAVGKTFPWHEVYGKDTAKVADFYSKALGWTTTVYPMEGGDYTMLSANGQAVVGVIGNEQPGMENVPPHWATYIYVPEVDAAAAQCVALGGRICHGPLDVPTVGRMVLIMDPFGATFWLFTPTPPAE